jgi:MFS family permease
VHLSENHSASRRAALAFSAHAAAYFLSSFFRTANAVLSEYLNAAFDLSASELGFITSLFYFAVAAAQIPVGILLDRVGPKRVVPVALLVGAAGSALFALAPNAVVLAIGRTLIGFGMGAVLMGAAKTLSMVYTDHRYPAAFGLLVGIGTAGGLASAAPLSLAAEAFGWRNAMLTGGLALAATAAVIRWLTPPLSEDTEPQTPVGPSLRRIFADRVFLRVALFSVFMAGGLLSIRALWAGPYLSVVHELPTLRVGTALTLATAGMVIGYPVIGSVAQRRGTSITIFAAGVGFVLCFLSLALLPAATPYWAVLALYFLFGFVGSAEIQLITQAKQAFPPAFTGRATTLVNVVAIGSSFLLQWLFGVAVDALVVLGAEPTLGYRLSFGFIALLGTVTLAVYAPLPIRERAGGPIGSG